MPSKSHALGKKPSRPLARCEHIGIFVCRLEAVSRFYVRRLGFRLKKDFIVGKALMKQVFNIDSDCRIQYLYRDSLRIELFKFLNAPMRFSSTNVYGYNHWALVVNDKVRFCQGLARKKVKVICLRKPDGRTYFIKDPESRLIEIREP